MKRLVALLSFLLIGLTPSTASASKQYPDEDFTKEDTESIFSRLECLRRGGATHRQGKEYLEQQLRKLNVTAKYYDQIMTDQTQQRKLDELNKILKSVPNFCKQIQKMAFYELPDSKHVFAVSEIESELHCINQIKAIRDDVESSDISRWLRDNQAQRGVTPAIYGRLLKDKLVMPQWIKQSRKLGCNKEDSKVAVSLFLKEYIGDSSSSKIPLNQLSTDDFQSPHERCKDARDYQGCMNYKNNSSIKNSCKPSSSIQEYCPDDYEGGCVAGGGRDRFDLKKIKGWWYKEFEDGDVLYFNPKIFRVPHKGQPSRYIAEKQVFRYYAEPTAGTPGSYTTLGSATTNCTGYGSTINCTTTPPTRMYIPGTSGSSGGVKSIKRTKVVDCKDSTWTFYIDGQPSKWRKDADKKALFSKCSKRSNLPVLEMKL